MKHENNYDGKTDRPCIRQTPAVSLLALRSKLLILNAAREDSLRSEEHTSELQSQSNLVCRLLLEKKKLNDFPPPARLVLPPQVHARLAPEFATASLANHDGDGGVAAMVRRRVSHVRVHVAGRIRA